MKNGSPSTVRSIGPVQLAATGTAEVNGYSSRRRAASSGSIGERPREARVDPRAVREPAAALAERDPAVARGPVVVDHQPRVRDARPVAPAAAAQRLGDRLGDRDVTRDDHERPAQLAHLAAPGVDREHHAVGGDLPSGRADDERRRALERDHRRALEHASRRARAQRAAGRARAAPAGPSPRSPRTRPRCATRNPCAPRARPGRPRRTAPRRGARSPRSCCSTRRHCAALVAVHNQPSCR